MSDTVITGEITNHCTCTVYDEETGEYTNEPTEVCYGECWEMAVEDFTHVTQELRDSNETGWWRVDGLRLWNGNVGGLFHADTVKKLIEGMTVNSDWEMRYKVFPFHIEYSLSHHDAPMGSFTKLYPVTESQREEWGLY
jgi:hypothetical protein